MEMTLTYYPPQFVFDFNAGVGVAKGAGGNITVANLADFPFLVGQDMSLAVGNMAYASPLPYLSPIDLIHLSRKQTLRIVHAPLSPPCHRIPLHAIRIEP